ncbi:MAG: carboxypeptidase-like regulatory domain-containing protein, partial [Planctomycetota bacterium]
MQNRLALLALLALSAPASAQIRVPAVLDDGMVLQRGEATTLFGRAQPGATITVVPSWTKGQYTTTTDAAGEWRVQVAADAAGGPHTLRISGDGERVVRD